MKKFLASFALMLAFAVPAQAGILSSLLTFNGTADSLIDQSVDNILDVNADGIGLGDVLYGIAQVDQYALDGGASVNVAPPRVAVAVAAQITGYQVVGTGGTIANPFATVRLTFGAVVNPNLQLTSLLGTGFQNTLSTTSLFGVFESSNPTPLPTNFVDTVVGGIPTGLANFTTADWVFVAEGGIVAANDFFEAEVQFFTGGSNVGKIRGEGDQVGGLTITNHTFGAGTTFLPVDITNLDGDDSSHDIVFSGSIFNSPTTGNALTNGWKFGNDASYTINAVPEPSSMVAFAGLIGAGLLIRRRRK